MRGSVKIEDLKTIDDYADRLSKQSTKIDAAKVRIVKAFETLRLATDRTTESLNELDFSQMMDTLTKLDLSRPIDELENMSDALDDLAEKLVASEAMSQYFGTSDWNFYRQWLQENDFADGIDPIQTLKTMTESYESVKDMVAMLEFALRNWNDDILKDGKLSSDRSVMNRYMRDNDGHLAENIEGERVEELLKDLKRWQERRNWLGAIIGVDDERSNVQVQINKSRRYLDKVSGEADLKEQAKVYENLLAKYQDYEEQRKSISEKFAKDRAQIEKAVDSDGRPIGEDVKDRALAELAKQERAALKSVDEAQLTELGKENKVLVDLFADTSEKSVAEVQKIIDRIKVLMDYLRGTKDAEGTAVIKDGNGKTERRITQKDMAGLGFSPAELKALEKSPEKLKALTEQYEKLKKEVLGKNPFRALADAVGELFKHGEDGEEKGLEAKLKRLGESAAASAEMVGDLAGRLSEMFEAAGNDGMAEAMDAVQGVMTSVSNIGRGFAEGGVVGGIAAAAGEAIGWVTKAFQASARHKAALEKIMEEVTAQQREYNMLLMEQNLELEKAQTIFGTDTYGKAANAVRVMKDAYAGLKAEIAGTAEQQKKFGYLDTGNAFWNKIVNKGYSELKDAYSGLADIEIKTGHKKTGLFGWGKGKDTYSSILDVYPELIDSAGNFNRELAESIMNSREFAKNDKEALQYIIDLYDQAEEAWESVKDYFEGVFGDLGQTLTDALVDAFKNGTDAGKAFADSLTGMLEKLAEQMIYTVTIAPLLEKAQEEMLDVMKREDLTDEEKFGNYVRILDDMTDNALSQQGTFNALLEKYRQMAKEKGLDLWQGDSTTQTGKSGAYTTASQESITKLEGLYTAMLVHETNIDTNVENVAGCMQTALGHLKRIDTNTGECSETLKLMRKDMRDMKDDLTTLRRDGIKTR
ncbi:hypothetical protein KTQ94_01180 [Prevotella stercorea]|uniref:hypothetical protein n=1 Tax=Leyella stercorea TaxID=363265 RepID=UPI001C2BAE96|nr:hypothetical protein [Leyella stercorea]MBU9897324.1 hypothetical protein [Leyella stercorea]MBU9946470.1 hypothetical protein [Leyella stercorea]